VRRWIKLLKEGFGWYICQGMAPTRRVFRSEYTLKFARESAAELFGWSTGNLLQCTHIWPVLLQRVVCGQMRTHSILLLASRVLVTNPRAMVVEQRSAKRRRCLGMDGAALVLIEVAFRCSVTTALGRFCLKQHFARGQQRLSAQEADTSLQERREERSFILKESKALGTQ
jgi:hypothetical protein